MQSDTAGAAEASKSSLHTTLSFYFKHVMTLPEYLALIIPSWSKERIDEIFHPSHATSTTLQRALHTLSVGVSACNVHSLPNFPLPPPVADPALPHHDVVTDIVRRSQARIIAQEQKYSQNMLTLGYRRTDERDTTFSMLGVNAVTNYYVNACVTRILMERQWHVLLAHVGEQVFGHLLVSTALFLPLGDASSTNLTQVLGTSVNQKVTSFRKVDVEQPTRAPQTAGRKRKRRVRTKKRGEQNDNTPSNPAPPPRPSAISYIKRTPAEVDLLRNRIFYGKPTRSRARATIYGLPTSDILHRSSTTSSLTKRAREVSRYIWPREYGLNNVFSVPDGSKASAAMKDERETEHERRRKLNMLDEALRSCVSLSTPERLLPVQRLIAIMVRKHDKMDYRRALSLCCPSTLPKTLTESERKTIAADLSEVRPRATAATSTQHVDTLADAMDLDAMDNEGVGPQVPSTAPLPYSSKSHFTKYRAPQGCVARFVRLVVRQLVPQELFGSAHNTGVVMRAIDRFVTLRRFESMSLHEVLHGFRLLDCTWLLPRSKSALWQRPTRDEMAKRQRMLHEFLFWLFDSIVVSLLRNNFYATESSKFHNRVLFFRHDDWSTITLPILDAIKDACFERIPKHKAVGIMSQRSFGYSFVRLLPKEVGMRPIVNLRRHSTKIDRDTKTLRQLATQAQKNAFNKKQKQDEWGRLVRQNKSINRTLRTTFQVLDYEKRAHSEEVGSSVFGSDDVFARLSQYKRRLPRRSDGSLPRLYFVKMDVAAAFDCINQEMLLKIVDGILRHDRYVVQHYVKLSTSHNGRQHKLFPRVVCPEEEHGTFEELAAHLAATQAWRNTIVADGVSYSHGERATLITLLREHVGNNLIKVGKDFCRQTIGISQGSTLSTLLCCYYLARMERDLCLTPRAKDERSLLMRWTDDFLFISTDKEAVRRFFVNVQKGSAEFNCVLAPAKSLCNFNLVSARMGEEMARVAGAVRLTMMPYMPWCGYRIDTSTLAVRYDIERYRWDCMTDRLTVPMRKTFAVTVPRAYTFTVQQHASPIYLDLALNTLDGALINVYQAFVMSTMRMLATLVAAKKRYGEEGGAEQREAREVAFLLRCITVGITMCYGTTCTKMQREKVKARAGGVGDAGDGEQVDPWPVSALAYRWLALHATHTALGVWPRTHSTKLREEVYRHLKCTQRQSYTRKPELQSIARRAWQDVRSVVQTVRIR